MTIDYTPQEFDMLVDAAALGNLRCARLFQLKIVWGFRPPKNEYITMGSCTHKLIEMYCTNTLPSSPMALLSVFETRQLDMEKYLPKLLAVSATLKQWSFHPVVTDTDGVAGIEYRFLIRYGNIGNYTIYLAGTMDRIEEFPGISGLVYISDWKTTSKPHKGPWTANEFAMTFQLYFYLYGLRNYLQEKFPQVTGAVARILAIHYNALPVTIQPSATIELQPQIEEKIPRMLEDAIAKIHSILELGDELAYPEGLLYGACARCDFQPFCTMKTERLMKQEIQSQFQQKTYNPLKHGEDDDETQPS